MNYENISVDIKDSILNSVKKLLGIYPESKEFDVDIIMNINAAISTLRQLGIGPKDAPYVVEDETQTYNDYLGENSSDIPQVKMYLYYKCRLGFDPPQSSLVAESIKNAISEAEWRLNFQSEINDDFQNDSFY